MLEHGSLVFFDALQLCRIARLWHDCSLSVVCLSVCNGCIMAEPWVIGKKLVTRIISPLPMLSA